MALREVQIPRICLFLIYTNTKMYVTNAPFWKTLEWCWCLVQCCIFLQAYILHTQMKKKCASTLLLKRNLCVFPHKWMAQKHVQSTLLHLPDYIKLTERVASIRTQYYEHSFFLYQMPLLRRRHHDLTNLGFDDTD